MRRDILRRALLCLFALSLCIGAQADEDMPLSFSSRLTTVFVGREYDLLALLEGTRQDGAYDFSISDPSIAQIRGSMMMILSEGYARITAGDSSGNTATMYIRASSAIPSRRALIISEQNYDDGRVRIGAENTARGIEDALSNLSYRQGTPFETTVSIDVDGENVGSVINAAFQGSTDDDVNLFYYLNYCSN